VVGRCSQWEQCSSFKDPGCKGCGFQHFEKIIKAHDDNYTLRSLGEKYFKRCSDPERRKGTGGRIALDEPIKKLLLERLPYLRQVSASELKSKLTVKMEEVDFKPKYDVALEANGKYVFIEVKGYGDNTNDILSAITAAQLLKEIPKYKSSLYYYVGSSSGKYPGGMKREHLHDKTRLKIYPYVRWAESKGFIKFYGIVDINPLLEEIKRRTECQNSTS